MALKGRLKDFGITQLLNLVNLARKTGTLYLDGSEGKVHLCFREGKLIYLAMQGEEKNLLTLLLEANKLTSKQVQIVESNMAGRTDRDIAMTLVQAGHIKQQDVAASARQNVLEQMYRIFSWQEGTFRFEPSALPVQGKMTVSIALENVIMEGSRRLKEWERLQEEVPDLDVPLKFAERPTTPLRDINLTVEEWRVISFVNPRNTIRRIAQSNNMSEFQIRKIAYSLLQAGLVEFIHAPRQAVVHVKNDTPGRKRKGQDKKVIAKPVSQRRPAVKRGLIHKLIDRIREL
ncbi:MAG: DUF4388 domain-containing protein [Chloroflexota bacterium]|nr:DUF4388 domain-containing protein [Chloroflexota bacterium]